MIRGWFIWRNAPLTRRERVVLGLLAVLALALTLPMRLALGWAAVPGISARAVEGPVWSAMLYDMRAGNLPLGDVAARLRLLPLLLGRREIHVAGIGPGGGEFRADGRGGRGWIALDDVNGSIAPGGGMGAVPVNSLGFEDFRVTMSDGQCREAGGKVSLVLAPLSDLMPAPVALTGRARCDKGALYVPMTGPSGMERVFLRVAPDGKWRADLVLAGLPPEISAPLLDSGFSARPGGIGIAATGTL